MSLGHERTKRVEGDPQPVGYLHGLAQVHARAALADDSPDRACPGAGGVPRRGIFWLENVCVATIYAVFGDDVAVRLVLGPLHRLTSHGIDAYLLGSKIV